MFDHDTHVLDERPQDSEFKVLHADHIECRFNNTTETKLRAVSLPRKSSYRPSQI